MERNDPWAAYFYPETIDGTGSGTLRNKLGERNEEVLRVREYAKATVREDQLRDGTAKIDHTYDAEHLKAIHRHLFQDVYDWAGEFREVDMRKGSSAFASIDNGEVDLLLAEVQHAVHEIDWPSLDADQFAMSSAVLFSYVNQAHPFREGNGRTSKIFMEHVAEQSRFSLDFSRIDKNLWNAVSDASRPKPDRPHVDPLPLVSVFMQATQERAAKSAAGIETQHNLAEASYPKLATESTRPSGLSASMGAAKASHYLPGRGYGRSEGR